MSAVRSRYECSWLREVGLRLHALDFGNQATLLGAGLLASLLPLIILLSAFASERVDDDLALRLGLNPQAATIVSHLFRTSTPSVNAATVLSLVFVFAGTVAVASSLRQTYEKTFGADHQARAALRPLLWVGALCGVVAVESLVGRAARLLPLGSIAAAVASLAIFTPFFWWTMHFLLSGRVPWRRLVYPAGVTGALLAGVGLFSEAFFSSWVIADDQTYGAIGAVFSILTWLVMIGAALIVGPVAGAVWQQRTSRRRDEG